MDAILKAIGYIYSYITKALQYVGSLVKAAFVAVWDLLIDLVCTVLEQGFNVALDLLNSIDPAIVLQIGQSWGSIGGQVLEGAQAVGVFTALQMITGAILIRFVLQLIPFTRLGS